MQTNREKRAFILGLARSGRAAARLLSNRGFSLALYDDDETVAKDFLNSQLWSEIGGSNEIVPGGSAERALAKCGCLVLSPGVPLDHALVAAARELGLEVIGELEVAFRFCSSRVVGITGTNGKSTVVDLTGKILKTAGISSVVAGNIGEPFSAVVSSLSRHDTVVLEVSSFQLDTIDGFKADVAVLLNVTPDHLDRYGNSFERYVSAKSRILNQADEGTCFVYNEQDPVCRRCASTFGGVKIPFSSEQKPAGGVYYEGGMIVRNWGGVEEAILPRKEFTPVGIHNLENALAAVAVVTALGVERDPIAEALRLYRPLPHRMELVRVVGGVAYINDSKATNVDAAAKSLRSLDGRVVLIMGGRDKEGDFGALFPFLGNVKKVVLLGEARAKIAAALSGRCPTSGAETMEEAVEKARKEAEPGDTVLLSPGCASFDMFADYEERGEAFRSCVKDL